jgi:hypothetical protein
MLKMMIDAKIKEYSIDLRSLHDIANVFVLLRHGTYWLEKYRWEDFKSKSEISKDEFDLIIENRDRIVVVEKDSVKLHKFDYVKLTS